MNKKYLPVTILLTSLFFGGCLVGHKITYEIKLDKSKKGTATVTYSDIRSDAQTEQEFLEDQKNLFDYMAKSPKFIKDRKAEGMDVVSRNLKVADSKLNGTVVYNFSKLTSVENLSYESGFYFITLALDDSVVTTNGEIIKSHNYKRILWDETATTLKFEILTEPSAGTKLRPMAAMYKPGK
jgi:hypothetical protein